LRRSAVDELIEQPGKVMIEPESGGSMISSPGDEAWQQTW
jgi:hypothetical protein